MSKIDCQYPTLLFNPNLNKLVLLGYRRVTILDNTFTLKKDDVSDVFENIDFYLKGVNFKRCYRNIVDNSEISTFDYKKLGKEKKHYVPIYFAPADEIIEKCTISNGHSTEPLFIAVPCQTKCPICRAKKIRKWSSRVKMHCAGSQNAPMIVTLTISPAFFNKYGIEWTCQNQVTLIQKFLKRLRINISRAGFNNKFKYFLTSEHGSEKGRLHFHAVFMDLDAKMYKTIKNIWNDCLLMPYIFRFNHFLRMSWKDDEISFGIITCEIAYDESGEYNMKYINKQDNICLHSQKIAYEQLEKYKENLINSPTSQYLYYNGRYSGKISISDWILKRTLPKLVESLPVDFRDALFFCAREYVTLMRWYKLQTNKQILTYISNDAINKYFVSLMNRLQDFKQKYGDLINVLYYDELENLEFPNIIHNENFLIDSHNSFVNNFNTLNTYDIDIDKCLFLAGQRNKRILYTNFVLKDYDISLSLRKAEMFLAKLENKRKL